MPAKVAVHLHLPTHDKEIVVKKPLMLNGQGRYRDDKVGIDVALMPGMSHHAGTVELQKDTMSLLQRDLQRIQSDASEIIHIDAEAGKQIKYTGKEHGFVGIPGPYTYKAETGKDSQELYEGRKPKENHTVFIWLVISVMVSIVGNIVMAAMAFG